jgi:asparagine synthase (glutamine-hydrolysing)
MCGIFGFWLRRPMTDEDIGLGRRATAMLAHRGPDGQGEWLDRGAGIFFGHRRLAILDLSSASDQPMQRGESIVVFNGEIYNFPELRAELAAEGYNFTTEGDTEVLLAAWQRWGAACLDRFDGMFAFAVYDGSRLHLVTDPFGEKPLFVAETKEGVYFSSEPQVLITDEDQVAQFLALGFIPSPGTGFSGMEWLPPATLCSYSKARLLGQRRYWEVHRASERQGKTKLTAADIDRLADVLIRLLRRRLKADVPVGLFLSSGVDSALIGALASRELGVPLKSMTVSFSDGIDEATSAAAIAAHLGLPHQVIDSRNDDCWTDLPGALAKLYGIPNDNVTALSVQQMSHLARRQMIVALGGVGGDEAFYGYNKYEFLHRHRWLYRLPQSLFAALRPPRALLSMVPRWANLERLLNSPPQARFLALKNAEIGTMLRSGVLRIPSLPDFDPCGRDLVCAVRDFDLRQTLPASYASAVDRGSMRAGVEVRTPYLARELFDFVSDFAPSAMFDGGQKAVLRRLLRRYLPADLVDQPKRGFVFPLKRYMGTLGERTPTVGGLEVSVLSDLWARRLDSGCDTIALRLMVLERFKDTKFNF